MRSHTLSRTAALARRFLGPGTIATVSYVAMTFFFLVPQSLRPHDTVGYVGDSLDSTYAIAWTARCATQNPLDLFDPPILHPHRGVLALFGHRILPGLVATPVIWASDNPVLGYNFAVLVGLVLTAAAGRLLGLALGLSQTGAWATGALYGFNTYQINEVARTDLVYHGLSTLALLFLLRLFRDGRRIDAWSVALFMWLQGLASSYLLLYGCVLLGFVALAFLAVRPRLAKARLTQLVAPAAAALALSWPILGRAWAANREYGLERELPSGMDLRLLFTTTETNIFWGQLNAPAGLQSGAPHFIGFVAMALSLYGLMCAARRSVTLGPSLLPARVWAAGACGMALVFGLLALGADMTVWDAVLGPGPYRLLYRFVPGFDLIRLPERWTLLMMLFVALLAGLGVTALSRRSASAALAAALLLPAEHLALLPTTQRLPVGREVAPVYRWLEGQPVGALVEVPANGPLLVRRDTVEEYFSLFHRHRIVHGYVSYAPPLSMLLRRAAVAFPSPSSLATLARAGVDTVLVHRRPELPPAFHKAVREAIANGSLVSLGVFHPGRTLPAPEVRAPNMRGRPVEVAELSFGDEVLRLRPPWVAAAPLPDGRRVRDPRWRWSATAGTPELLGDGDARTAWEAVGSAGVEVRFDRAVDVTGVILPVSWRTRWPRRLEVQGLTADGRWVRLGRLGAGELVRLVEQLMEHPGGARLGFGFRSAVAGIRLQTPDLHSDDEWVLEELEILSPATR